MNEPIIGVPLTHRCIITSQRVFASLLPSDAGQISQLPKWESFVFIDISDTLYWQNIRYKSTIIKWALHERSEKNYTVSLQRWLQRAAINAHLHKDKNGFGRLLGWSNIRDRNNLSLHFILLTCGREKGTCKVMWVGEPGENSRSWRPTEQVQLPVHV